MGSDTMSGVYASECLTCLSTIAFIAEPAASVNAYGLHFQL